MERLDRMPWALKDAVFAKLAEIADVERMTEKERRVYDETLKVYRDYYGTLDGAFIQGKEKGIEEGIEKGQFDMAMNMLKKGYPLEDVLDIVKSSGMSDEEISKLREYATSNSGN